MSEATAEHDKADEIKSTLIIEGNTFSNLVLIFHVALFFSWVETSTKQCE